MAQAHFGPTQATHGPSTAAAFLTRSSPSGADPAGSPSRMHAKAKSAPQWSTPQHHAADAPHADPTVPYSYLSQETALPSFSLQHPTCIEPALHGPYTSDPSRLSRGTSGQPGYPLHTHAATDQTNQFAALPRAPCQRRVAPSQRTGLPGLSPAYAGLLSPACLRPRTPYQLVGTASSYEPWFTQ